MIPVPSGVRVWLATGSTDMRRGMSGLSLQVQQALGRDPFAGDLYVFRGRKGDFIKILWHDAERGTTVAFRACRFMPSGSNAAISSGRRRPMGWCRSRRPSLTTCLRASTGVSRSAAGGRVRRAERRDVKEGLQTPSDMLLFAA